MERKKEVISSKRERTNKTKQKTKTLISSEKDSKRARETIVKNLKWSILFTSACGGRSRNVYPGIKSTARDHFAFRCSV